MVSAKTNKRKTVKKVKYFARIFRYRTLLFGSLALFIGIITFMVVFIVNIPNLNTGSVDGDITEVVDDSGAEEITENIDMGSDSVDDSAEENKPKLIDYQEMIDAWAKTVGGQKGVIIYDLDLGATVGQYNADTKFSTASLYKLFVVYAGYEKVQNGEWDGAARAGTTGYDINTCLDLAIRESHSPCAETLWTMLGRQYLDDVVQSDYGLPGIVVANLSATPREISQMLKRFYLHSEITDGTLVDRMMDSFLNQPATTYNWRQGLPSGFSDLVKVYNKVGWNYDADRKIWEIYDDAAIVSFTNENRNYIVVVMTNGIHYSQIRKFATQFEAKFYEASR